MEEIPPGGGTPRRRKRPLPTPGARVKAYGKYARVMPYDARWSPGSFPVRFEESGRWAVLDLDDLAPQNGNE